MLEIGVTILCLRFQALCFGEQAELISQSKVQLSDAIVLLPEDS